MQSKAARSTALVLFAGMLGAACSPATTPPPRGAPVLTGVYWIAGGAPVRIWAPEATTFIASSVPPFASEVDFVFDRRLDGNLIEDMVVVDGVPTTRPKAMAPIEVQWPGMADRPGDPPLKLYVAYNSAGRYGAGTSYVLAKPQPQGFPSSETLMFLLHREALASPYGEPAEAPEMIPAITGPLGVSITAPSGAASLKFQVPLVFTNRLPPLGATSPFIHVTAAGGAVPYRLLADASQISRVYVAPADCLGAWPGGASLVVTVEAGMPDAFGGTLAQPATVTFTTSAGPPAAAGATCTVAPPDAGTTDGGGMDGGATDGGASEGGAPDGGGSDGGTPDGGAPEGGASEGGAFEGGDADASDVGDAAADMPASFDGGDAADAAVAAD